MKTHTKMNKNAQRWFCPTCGKIRSTLFCGDCGLEKIESSPEGEGRINDLRELFVYTERQHQSIHNRLETERRNGDTYLSRKLEVSEDKWRRMADACRWALNQLS
jgi:hypothetical protein